MLTAYTVTVVGPAPVYAAVHVVDPAGAESTVTPLTVNSGGTTMLRQPISLPAPLPLALLNTNETGVSWLS